MPYAAVLHLAGKDLWEDEAQHEYEVYVKGQLEMGPFANLMERVEYIGKAMGRRASLGNEEIVYR